ncbi:MAG TPA: aldo/keto reductase [bacterium]
MDYVTLPGTELRCSRVGLGTWSMGGFMWGGADARDAERTVLAALERGITFIDSAPVYGLGASEEMLGRVLEAAGARGRVVLATKAGLEWRGGRIWRNATPERLRRELEDSLRRLRTGAIDLYQLHWPDPRVPIQEAAEVFAEFHRRGAVRAIGVSNCTPEEIDVFRQAAPLHAVQPRYNLFERDIEADLLPYCRRHGLPALVYSPLCRSLLGGRITAGARFEEGDLRASDPKFRGPRAPAYLAAVEALGAFAASRGGRTVAQLALRWALDRPGVGCALLGARRPEQLGALDGVDDWRLTEADMRAIDECIREFVPDPVGAGLGTPAVREPERA